MKRETEGKTGSLQVVLSGSGELARPALIRGDRVLITVDCAEDYTDPLPLARKIVLSVENHSALVEALSAIVRQLALWPGEKNPEMFDSMKNARALLKSLGIEE